MRPIRKDVLEKLFVTPVIEHVQGKTNSLGDRAPDSDKQYTGYVVVGFVKILNQRGEEAISGTQIYLNGPDAESIRNDSRITCLDQKEQLILSKKVWRGRDGLAIIGTLYLP